MIYICIIIYKEKKTIIEVLEMNFTIISSYCYHSSWYFNSQCNDGYWSVWSNYHRYHYRSLVNRIWYI